MSLPTRDLIAIAELLVVILLAIVWVKRPTTDATNHVASRWKHFPLQEAVVPNTNLRVASHVEGSKIGNLREAAPQEQSRKRLPLTTKMAEA